MPLPHISGEESKSSELLCQIIELNLETLQIIMYSKFLTKFTCIQFLPPPTPRLLSEWGDRGDKVGFRIKGNCMLFSAQIVWRE